MIDYLAEDCTRNGETYDLVFDAVGKHAYLRVRGAICRGARRRVLEVLDAVIAVDPTNLEQDVQKQLTAQIDQQRVMQAAQSISAWARTRCA